MKQKDIVENEEGRTGLYLGRNSGGICFGVFLEKGTKFSIEDAFPTKKTRVSPLLLELFGEALKAAEPLLGRYKEEVAVAPLPPRKRGRPKKVV